MSNSRPTDFTFTLRASVPTDVALAVSTIATFVNNAAVVPATASVAKSAQGVLGELEAAINRVAG